MAEGNLVGSDSVGSGKISRDCLCRELMSWVIKLVQLLVNDIALMLARSAARQFLLLVQP